MFNVQTFIIFTSYTYNMCFNCVFSFSFIIGIGTRECMIFHVFQCHDKCEDSSKYNTKDFGEFLATHQQKNEEYP